MHTKKYSKIITAILLSTTMLMTSGCGNKTSDNSSTELSSSETITDASADDNTEVETTDEEKVEPYKGTYDCESYNIPVVSIVIDESKGTISDMNNDPDHNTKCYGSIEIQVPDDYSCNYTDSYEGGTYELDFIRGRGNSTWKQSTDKKPYRIKLSKKANLFNMGKAKNYALLGNPFDPSRIKNRITFDLAKDLDMEYSIQGVHVALYMNGKYLGNYLLCEMVEVNDERVAIDDLEKSYTDNMSETDLSGGYLLGMHREEDGHGKLIETNHKEVFNIASPESDEKNAYPDAEAYISKYMQTVEDSLYNNLNDDQTTHNFTEYIDKDSAIKNFWLQEFSSNPDAYITSSTYLYKKKDIVNSDGSINKGMLYWGPAWDYDYAYSPSENAINSWVTSDPWARLMMCDKAFCDEVIAYWPTFREKLMNYAADGGIIDKYAEEIKQSEYAFYDSIDDSESKEYFDDQINNLKMFINNRIAWIDENLETIRPEKLTYHFVVNGEEIYTDTGLVGCKYMNLPEAPTVPGKTFIGWQYEAYDAFSDSTMPCDFSPDYPAYVKTDGTGADIILNAAFSEE